MFTGIVDHCGEIREIVVKPNARRFVIECRFSKLVEGESIAVDGACLTVLEPGRHRFSCGVSSETLERTTFKGFTKGRRVNLERPLRLSDRLGGHFVMGHVDSIARVEKITTLGAYIEVRLVDRLKRSKPFLIPKGSIAINGVSLTINTVRNTTFSLMLIPHTLGRTNLSSIKRGAWVNVEWDWLVKTVYYQRRLK